jgi:hypothetical protein
MALSQCTIRHNLPVPNRTVLAIAAVLVLFVIVGAFLVFRNQRGGGRPVTFNLSVTNATRMSPDRLMVQHGDVVTVNVRSDRSGEVHLHGYDIHFDAVPGEVSSHTIHANTTGHFDIEWESTSTRLGDLIVNP